MGHATYNLSETTKQGIDPRAVFTYTLSSKARLVGRHLVVGGTSTLVALSKAGFHMPAESNLMTLHAIETIYRGHKFRSRLEARWAIFLDALNIGYRYEYEGFDLDGLWYLPDFWLPRQRVWIEIKPTIPEDDDAHKPLALAQQTDDPVMLLMGDTWPGAYFAGVCIRDPQTTGVGLIAPAFWALCSYCEGIGFQYAPPDEPLSFFCTVGGCPYYYRTSEHDQPGNQSAAVLYTAFTAARQARFD